MKINQEHIVGISCLAVSGVILAITPTFPTGQATAGLTGPAFFPNLLAILYILCGIYQIWYGTVHGNEFAVIGADMVRSMAGDGRTRTAYIFIGLIAGFILLLDTLGFILTTLLFLVLFMKRLGVPVLKTILYAVIFTGTIYLLFGRLFAISLPSGILSYAGL